MPDLTTIRTTRKTPMTGTTKVRVRMSPTRTDRSKMSNQMKGIQLKRIQMRRNQMEMEKEMKMKTKTKATMQKKAPRETTRPGTGMATVRPITRERTNDILPRVENVAVSDRD
ncbi:MAG: hypothetical protein ABEI31_05080 [Halodesulfurarchaeum sp.]